MWFGVGGSGSGVQGVGSRVWVSEYVVQGLGYRVWVAGSGIRGLPPRAGGGPSRARMTWWWVSVSGFRVSGFGCGVESLG